MTQKSRRTARKAVNRQRPLLVVLSAPSGAGKTTLVKHLLQRSRRFCKSVSATTRQRRRGEREGRDYFFLTQPQFRNKARRDQFIETAEVFGEWYGTPKSFVTEAEKKGKTVLFDIDIQGGRSVKKWRPDAVLIFVLPPNRKVLRQRLEQRSTETEASFRLRQSRALKEISNWSKYDYVVCNDELDATVALIETIIRAESQRTIRVQATEVAIER